MEELELLKLAQLGDLPAFNQLVIAYQDLVYRQALYLLQDTSAAEDLTQEVFIKVFRNLPTLRGATLKAWLLRVTTNAAYDELRRAKRRPTLPLFPEDSEQGEYESPTWLIDPGPSLEDLAERGDLAEALSFALSQLRPDYRAAVVMVDVQELDYEEASRALKIPIGTLKSRVSRARLQLRSLVQDWISGDAARPAASGWGQPARRQAPAAARQPAFQATACA